MLEYVIAYIYFTKLVKMLAFILKVHVLEVTSLLEYCRPRLYKT